MHGLDAQSPVQNLLDPIMALCELHILVAVLPHHIKKPIDINKWAYLLFLSSWALKADIINILQFCPLQSAFVQSLSSFIISAYAYLLCLCIISSL